MESNNLYQNVNSHVADINPEQVVDNSNVVPNNLNSTQNLSALGAVAAVTTSSETNHGTIEIEEWPDLRRRYISNSPSPLPLGASPLSESHFQHEEEEVNVRRYRMRRVRRPRLRGQSIQHRTHRVGQRNRRLNRHHTNQYDGYTTNEVRDHQFGFGVIEIVNGVPILRELNQQDMLENISEQLVAMRHEVMEVNSNFTEICQLIEQLNENITNNNVEQNSYDAEIARAAANLANQVQHQLQNQRNVANIIIEQQNEQQVDHEATDQQRNSTEN